MYEITLIELREALAKQFGRDDVVITLIPGGDWIFDPTAKQLTGARERKDGDDVWSDQFLIGRKGRGHFDVAQRDPRLTPGWHQLEAREEPLVLQPASGVRTVGYVLIEYADGTDLIKVSASSLTKEEIRPQDGDLTIGHFGTNRQRIDGEVCVLGRKVLQVGEGWKSVVEWSKVGDGRFHTPLMMAGLLVPLVPVRK